MRCCCSYYYLSNETSQGHWGTRQNSITYQIYFFALGNSSCSSNSLYLILTLERMPPRCPTGFNATLLAGVTSTHMSMLRKRFSRQSATSRSKKPNNTWPWMLTVSQKRSSQTRVEKHCLDDDDSRRSSAETQTEINLSLRCRVLLLFFLSV